MGMNLQGLPKRVLVGDLPCWLKSCHRHCLPTRADDGASMATVVGSLEYFAKGPFGIVCDTLAGCAGMSGVRA